MPSKYSLLPKDFMNQHILFEKWKYLTNWNIFGTVKAGIIKLN